MSILDKLPTIALIYSFSTTSDGAGGHKRVWTESPVTTKARLYTRRGKMIIAESGIDNEIQTKAMFNISDRNNLAEGYKIVMDNIEYLVKRADVIYDKDVAHHIQAVLELYEK